jgi:hypothetical protein
MSHRRGRRMSGKTTNILLIAGGLGAILLIMNRRAAVINPVLPPGFTTPGTQQLQAQQQTQATTVIANDTASVVNNLINSLF